MKSRMKYFICKRENTILGRRKLNESLIYLSKELIEFFKKDNR